jgi:hypothetical protein
VAAGEAAETSLGAHSVRPLPPYSSKLVRRPAQFVARLWGQMCGTMPGGTVGFSFPVRRDRDVWQFEFRRTRTDLSRRTLNPRCVGFSPVYDPITDGFSRFFTVFTVFRKPVGTMNLAALHRCPASPEVRGSRTPHPAFPARGEKRERAHELGDARRNRDALRDAGRFARYASFGQRTPGVKSWVWSTRLLNT